MDENQKDANVGDPVSAKDADNDVLLYTLEDPDTDAAPTLAQLEEMFSIDSRTGQIKTKKEIDAVAGTSPNDAGTGETHKVQVKATDPSGASGTTVVTITINDVNDAPEFDKDDPSTADTNEAAKDDSVGCRKCRSYRLHGYPPADRSDRWRTSRR